MFQPLCLLCSCLLFFATLLHSCVEALPLNLATPVVHHLFWSIDLPMLFPLLSFHFCPFQRLHFVTDILNYLCSSCPLGNVVQHTCFSFGAVQEFCQPKLTDIPSQTLPLRPTALIFVTIHIKNFIFLNAFTSSSLHVLKLSLLCQKSLHKTFHHVSAVNFFDEPLRFIFTAFKQSSLSFFHSIFLRRFFFQFPCATPSTDRTSPSV